MTAHAGFDAVLKIGGVTVGEAQDVTLGMTRDEIEITTRDNVGWKTFIPGLAEMTVDFTLLNDRPNANVDLIETAFLAGDVVEDVDILDKDGYGFNADMAVLDFSRSEPLQDAVSISVSFKASTTPTKVVPAT